MDDLPAGRDLVVLFLCRHWSERLPAHLRDQRAEGLLHVADLIQLVVGPLPMEAQNRNSKAVDDIGIDLGVAVVVWNHLSPTRESYCRPIIPPVILLELLAVSAARWVALDPAHEARAGGANSSPHLDVVPAGKIELLVTQPPRHVDVHPSGAVFIVRDVVFHRGDVSGDVGAGRVGDVFADRAAGVGESLRKLWRF